MQRTLGPLEEAKNSTEEKTTNRVRVTSFLRAVCRAESGEQGERGGSIVARSRRARLPTAGGPHRLPGTRKRGEGSLGSHRKVYETESELIGRREKRVGVGRSPLIAEIILSMHQSGSGTGGGQGRRASGGELRSKIGG